MAEICFTVDLERHVYPLLDLARKMVSTDEMLRQVQSQREVCSEVDRGLDSIITNLGDLVADDVAFAILTASDLLKLWCEQQRSATIGGRA